MDGIGRAQGVDASSAQCLRQDLIQRLQTFLALEVTNPSKGRTLVRPQFLEGKSQELW